MSSNLYQDYNPIARTQTERQTRLLVLGFLVAFAVVVGLTAALVVWQLGFSRSSWADLAAMYLSCVTSVVCLVAVALLAGLSAVMVLIMRRLPPLFKTVYDILVLLSHRVQQITTAIVRPLIATHATIVWVRTLARSLSASLRPTRRRLP